MSYKHILIEAYCLNHCSKKQTFCCNGIDSIGLHCFYNNCEFLKFTYCPSEIAITNENGIVENLEDLIGFGGEMDINKNIDFNRKILLEKWYSICRCKINEAYDEYMKFRKTIE